MAGRHVMLDPRHRKLICLLKKLLVLPQFHVPYPIPFVQDHDSSLIDKSPMEVEMEEYTEEEQQQQQQLWDQEATSQC